MAKFASPFKIGINIYGAKNITILYIAEILNNYKFILYIQTELHQL